MPTIAQRLISTQSKASSQAIDEKISKIQYSKAVKRAVDNFRQRKLEEGYTELGTNEYQKVTEDNEKIITENVVVDPNSMQINIKTKTEYKPKPVYKESIDPLELKRLKAYERRMRERARVQNSKLMEKYLQQQKAVEDQKRIDEINERVELGKATNKDFVDAINILYRYNMPISQLSQAVVYNESQRVKFDPNYKSAVLEAYKKAETKEQPKIESETIMGEIRPATEQEKRIAQYEKEWEKIIGTENYDYYLNQERRGSEGIQGSDLGKAYNYVMEKANEMYDKIDLEDKEGTAWELAKGLKDAGHTVLIEYPIWFPLYSAFKFGGQTLFSGGRNLYTMGRTAWDDIIYDIDGNRVRTATNLFATLYLYPKAYKKAKGKLYEKGKGYDLVDQSKLTPEKKLQYESAVEIAKTGEKLNIEAFREPMFEEIFSKYSGATANEIKLIKEFWKNNQKNLEGFGSLTTTSYLDPTRPIGDLELAYKNTIFENFVVEKATRDLFNRLKKANPNEKYELTKYENKFSIKKLDKNSGKFEHFLEFEPEKRFETFPKRMKPDYTPEGKKITSLKEQTWRKTSASFTRGLKYEDVLNKDLIDLKAYAEHFKKLQKNKYVSEKLFKDWQYRNLKNLEKNIEILEKYKSSVKVPEWYKSITPEPVKGLFKSKKGSLGGTPYNTNLKFPKPEYYYFNLPKKKQEYNQYQDHKPSIEQPYYPQINKYKIPYTNQKYPSKYVPQPYVPQPTRFEYKPQEYPTTINYPSFVDLKTLPLLIFSRKKITKEQKKRLFKDQLGLANGYYPVITDVYGRDMIQGFYYPTEQEATSEGMIAVDMTPYERFKVKSKKVNPNMLKTGRHYRKVYKFRKYKDSYIEKQSFRKDHPREQKSNFNLYPYVFAK